MLGSPTWVPALTNDEYPTCVPNAYYWPPTAAYLPPTTNRAALTAFCWSPATATGRLLLAYCNWPRSTGGVVLLACEWPPLEPRAHLQLGAGA